MVEIPTQCEPNIAFHNPRNRLIAVVKNLPDGKDRNMRE